MTKNYFLYILSSQSGALYIGVTNDLERRLFEHQSGEFDSFTRKYHITRLVWFEATNDVNSAIAFEKKLKGWSRKKKLALVMKTNPTMEDLSQNCG